MTDTIGVAYTSKKDINDTISEIDAMIPRLYKVREQLNSQTDYIDKSLDDAIKIYPNTKIGEIIDVKESQVCMTCHGDVGNMTKVKHIRPLKMADCVNRHRDNNEDRNLRSGRLMKT